MQQARRGTALWGTVVLALAFWACETTRNPGGIQHDLTDPAIILTNTAGDTQDIQNGLRFNVSAVDNLALKSVRLSFSGGLLGVLDTVFTGTVKSYAVSRTISFPANSGAGGGITIVGRATDGAGNFAEDTLFIFLRNVQALQVILISPTPGAVASSGRNILVQVHATQNSGIVKIGFLMAPRSAVTNPTTPPNDSIVFLGTRPDTADYVDTLVVTATSGSFDVVGFAEDSAGRRGFSSIVTVTIQSAANDITPPQVAHKISPRVEVDDTVIIRATDASAISWIGFRVDTGGGVLLKFDTVDVTAGNLTDVTRRANLNLGSVLPPGALPKTIVVRGYACDIATPTRNCSYTNTTTLLPSAPAPAPGIQRPQLGAAGLIDTVIVVNGVTVGFPGSGSVKDAIYNGNLRELYLTNPALNRVDVFRVDGDTFVTGGITTAGGQPWGIALWPRDTLGGYKDTIVVADAGGTQLSIINVGAGGPRQILWRQDLPNFILQTYKVLITPGGSREEITSHDLSDIPQYVATVCRSGGGALCHSDSVFALYSTSPTVSSTSPFNGRGTLRMEKLINTTNPNLMYGKFFWEIATTTFTTGTDTLRIVLRRGRNFSKVVLSACAGVTVSLNGMGLGDRTFARNSGNFNHAFFGEGGSTPVAFARVMSYDARDTLLQGANAFIASCTTGPGQTDGGENDVDLGMSPGVDVSDFISNTGIKVQSIATNFNGLTNAVRADSIYYLDEDLRRKSTSAASPGTGLATAGMDMNYFHDYAPTGSCPPTSPSCGGTAVNSNNRLIFSASPAGNIDVFDTYFGAFIASIPVRDPVIGPLRVAFDNVSGEQLLFGVTTNGLLVLRLPAFINPLPAPPR
ncbi:MAG TPA: hypothetical protein VGQ06_09670 [Gemmatimonadales bacterium]|jgi:hypothetical protein|nr:hypothetical protein [Gemmatimonadales bacterium]